MYKDTFKIWQSVRSVTNDIPMKYFRLTYNFDHLHLSFSSPPTLVMRFNILPILGLCMRPAALQDPDLLWIDGGAATCYEKDVAPVDVDAVFSSSCVDLSGNLYPPHSTLRSCCDCFRLENISQFSLFYWMSVTSVPLSRPGRGWTRSAGWGACPSSAVSPVTGPWSPPTPSSPPQSWRTTVWPPRPRCAGSGLLLTRTTPPSPS